MSKDWRILTNGCPRDIEVAKKKLDNAEARFEKTPSIENLEKMTEAMENYNWLKDRKYEAVAMTRRRSREVAGGSL